MQTKHLNADEMRKNRKERYEKMEAPSDQKETLLSFTPNQIYCRSPAERRTT